MNVLGIDLAKLTFDVTLLTDTNTKHHKQFANTHTGFKKLQSWLRKHKVKQLHACMEATNVYWEDLAHFLHEQGYIVSVVNPARIKGYAQSQMQRNKTDKQDSETIASFCATQTLQVWTPPTPAQRKLRALVRHRDDLILTRVQQTNRLQDTRDEEVRASLQLLINTIKAQIQSVEKQIAAHLKANPDLKEVHRLMDSVPGVAAVTAEKLLAEFYDLAAYPSANAASADAGLTPANYESGTSVRKRPRLSKVGKASIRAALYWPAITVMTHSPEFKQFAARLAERGKGFGVILAAVMRKLIHIIYGVVKHKTPYDPSKVLGPTR